MSTFYPSYGLLDKVSSYVLTCDLHVLCQSKVCLSSQTSLHVWSQNVNMLVFSLPPVCFQVIHYVSNNLLRQVHSSTCKRVYRKGTRSRQVCVLGFLSSKSFHHLANFLFKLSIPPLHMNQVTCMHLIERIDSVPRHIGWHAFTPI